MQPFQPVRHQLLCIGDVAAARAHRKHGGHDPASRIIFIDEEIAAAVIHRGVAWHDTAPRLRQKRLRGRNEDLHDLEAPLEARPPLHRVGTRRKDHLLREDLATWRLHKPLAVLPRDVGGWRTRVYGAPLLHHGPCKPAGIAERVQVPALGVKPATIKTRTSGKVFHFLLVDEACPGTDCVVVLGLFLQSSDGTRAVGSLHITVLLPLTLDLVALDHAGDTVVGA